MYIMKRRIIDRIPKGQVVSVEREVFPTLLAEGVKTLGIVDDRYWLDLGTPAALLKGSADLVRGYAPSPLLSTNSALRLDRSALIFDDSVIDSSAEITGGSVVMPGAQVGAGAKVQGSVVSRGVRVGPNAIVQGCYLAEGVEVENGARIHDQVVC
jgi:mannose-1-phosphate guanylyltransferase